MEVVKTTGCFFWTSPARHMTPNSITISIMYLALQNTRPRVKSAEAGDCVVKTSRDVFKQWRRRAFISSQQHHNPIKSNPHVSREESRVYTRSPQDPIVDK
jgi:hypothetical protein